MVKASCQRSPKIILTSQNSAVKLNNHYNPCKLMPRNISTIVETKLMQATEWITV